MADFQLNYTGSQINTLLGKANTALQEVPDTVALKSELPTKTSDLTNDSGFLTEHQSLDGYAKTADLLEKSTDTWTFTLSDGSTVAKTIVLGE